VATEQITRRLRWGLIAVLAAAGVLMLTTSSGVLSDDSAGADVTGVFGKQMEVYGAYLWAWLLLAGSLLAVLGRPTEAAAGGARSESAREAADGAPRGFRAAG
jgi:hypothetical protein